MFFISCNNSQNEEKNKVVNEPTVSTKSKEDYVKEKIALSSEEIKCRETINNFLETKLLNYSTTYTPLDWTKPEKYSLIETSKFFLNRMKKAEAAGHSKEEQRNIAWVSYDMLKQSGNAELFYLPEGNGYKIAHKFRSEVSSGGIKTSNLLFYLDSTLTNVIYVDDVAEGVSLPDL